MRRHEDEIIVPMHRRDLRIAGVAWRYKGFVYILPPPNRHADLIQLMVHTFKIRPPVCCLDNERSCSGFILNGAICAKSPGTTHSTEGGSNRQTGSPTL
jgi:hypothetical protein